MMEDDGGVQWWQEQGQMEERDEYEREQDGEQ